MKKIQQGFTLIELMIVIAIIGILAAVALPAYQDYTVRAKVSELLLSADEAKNSFTEYFTANATFPSTLASAGISGTGVNMVASRALSGTSGILITSTGGSTLPSAAQSKTIVMYVTSTVNGQLTWKCGPTGAAAMPTKYLPASCRS